MGNQEEGFYAGVDFPLTSDGNAAPGEPAAAPIVTPRRNR